MDEHNESLHNIMESYYKYIGQCHVENVLWEVEKVQKEIDLVQIPLSLDQWFESYSKNAKAEEERLQKRHNRKRMLSKAAMFIVVLFVSFSFLTFTVDAVRIKVFNLIVDMKDLYSGIKVEEGIGKANTEHVGNEYYPKYVPEGYVMEGTSKTKDSITMKYENAAKESIVFSQGPMRTEFHFDTEASQLTDVTINGVEGVLVEQSQSDNNILFWNNQEYSFYIISALEPEILVQMANSLEKK